ncbi:MAG: hypothetical protein A2017_16690 [Lentisphaerae bacterium GWF2_44_16]|nr:MAG: hypothetical protein A2017_16690 [Lentisphaerae bacterium GWF2_44_16]
MMKRILIAISALMLIAGCMSQGKSKELDEIKAALEKQNADIAALRTNINELNKSFSLENTEMQKDRLVDAALLLVRNGPENTSSQAVQILGYLGGEKAEAALIDIVNNGPQNRCYSAMDALSNMQSKKLRDIVIKRLESCDSQRINSMMNILQNRDRNILLKEDLPLIEKALSSIDDNDYNNNRYVRNCLIGLICKFNQAKGVELVCKGIMTASEPYRKRELIYQVADRRTLSIASWEKIIKTIGDPEYNTEPCQAVLERIRNNADWRMTDLILPWAEFASSNDNFRQSYINALGNLKDPKAAGTMLALYKLASKTSPGNRYEHYFNNYPGIKKDGSNYVLVDDETMKKLMEQRAKRIEYLNKNDKE